MRLEDSDLDLDHEERRLLEELRAIRLAKKRRARARKEVDDFDIAYNENLRRRKVGKNLYRIERENINRDITIEDIEELMENPSPRQVVKLLVKKNPVRADGQFLKGMLLGGIGGYILRELLER